MRLINATVKFAAGKAFTTKYGRNRQSVKLEFKDGSEVDIWFDEGDRRYTSLRKGQTVQVLQEGDKLTLVTEDEDEQPHTPQATPAALSNVPSLPSNPQIKGLITADEEWKAQLFQEICKRAQVLRTCHVQMSALFTDKDGECIVDEETLQKYSVTLYLDIARYWK